ncbi:cysteine--tRNA ligase [Methyloferula stellata]|uniref:cysteine--tRNA ligase n=1 Tax=Methyloferula stellata TaxID=876270 RepID=UPI00036F0904|nr:cysteine--tRNA ligase [Methyloferula stellata]
MALRLYNTLTRQKDVFTPIDPAHVRLYACGPTVYDNLHIGNGRMLIVFDVLFRVLRHIYGAEHVKYVRNITDVDDKINARAAERGVDIRVLTDEMTKIFHEDAAELGCLTPTVEPRATEHMAEMIAIIEKLIANGHAYVAQGHVLFDVPSMPAYGQLSKRPLDELIAGARVEVAPYKRGPMDFVLWKPAQPSEPGWESPWGRGRPGWHIECSAMSWKHLGETFDIHGGGIDLVFPHHENEVAQTCSAFGHSIMANVWMHNGHLQVEGEKMSKSLGNFVTIRQALADWPGEVVRFNMLKTHYRQPIDWTIASLKESERELSRWYPVAKQYAAAEAMIPPEFEAALDDDLNTPEAITHLRRLYKEAVEEVAFAGARLVSSGQLLGLFEKTEAEWAHWKPASMAIDEIRVVHLINARLEARASKNWAESDRIRDELADMGVALKDNKDGTTSWEVKR